MLLLRDWASLMTQTTKNLPVVRERWVQSLGREDPLEKENGNSFHYSCWENPWIEEPGGLQLVKLQRVRHD